MELFCIDPATGKELWKRDLHPWDIVPNGEEIRKFILEYNQQETKVMKAYMPLGAAMRSRHGRGDRLTPEKYLELAKPLREMIPDMPATLADIKGHIIDSKGYEQLHFFNNVQPKYWPAIHEMRKKILDHGYLMDPWAGKYDMVGISMQTPVSDGKHIYVSTGFGAVFCVDLEGKIKWKKWFGGGVERAAAIPSPVLAGDVLVITTHDPKEDKAGRSVPVRMGLNKDTGEVVWTAPFKGSYQTGPIVMDLPIKGQEGKTVRVLVFNGDGTVLRAEDGVQLASGLPAAWTGRPWKVSGEIILFNNRSADGGGAGNIRNDYETGRGAMRLIAESRDKVVPEVLWQGKKFDWGTLVARGDVFYHMAGRRKIHGGKVYVQGEVSSYNLKTGEQIAKVSGPVIDSFHYTILAGDYLVGLDTDGFSGVAKVSPDGKTLKAIGLGRLGDRLYGKGQLDPRDKKFSYGCQMFASGNRLFIRSHTHLYCIGDPQQEMVLSPAHR